MPISLSQVKTQDQIFKDQDWERDWRDQRELYHDQGRRLLQRRLRDLKLGIKDDRQPIETSILRFVVDSLAVAYRSPATRWLARDGERLDDDDPRQATFRKTLKRSGFDATMRRVDRERTLYRQVVVRLYPDRRRRCVRLLPYTPLQVARWPDPSSPDDLRDDRAVAIKLSGEPHVHDVEDDQDPRRGLWELWERVNEDDPDSAWSMTRLAGTGGVLGASEQPYGATAGVPPYQTLPLVIAYDEESFDPWRPPKSSRTSWPLAIAATFNEVMSGIRWDSHPELVWEQVPNPVGTGVKPSDMPRETGAGIRSLLPPGVRANLLNISPQIGPALQAIDQMVEAFLHSESLPTDSFRQSQSVTGLGLRQLAKPQAERQEDLRQLAIDAERRIYEAYARVHNAFAGEWGVDTLPLDVELEVELGPVDVAVDEREETDVMARRMALGAASRVDAIQRFEGVDRPTALHRLEQINQDNEDYPLPQPAAPGGAEVEGEGPNLADPTPDEENPAASVVGAARATQLRAQ